MIKQLNLLCRNVQFFQTTPCVVVDKLWFMCLFRCCFVCRHPPCGSHGPASVPAGDGMLWQV